MKAAQELFAHYKQYHEHGPLMLRYAGILGAFGFPIFYLLRFTKASAPYDDFWIRLVATTLCVLLLLRDKWPLKLKPYYIAFSYPALIFSLPTFLVFTSLKNGGDSAAVGNTLMVVFFLILMTDWRNTIVMLVAGVGAATLLYVGFDPNPKLPREYVARFPLLVLVVIGGSFFKFAGNRAATEKIRRAYASIAGSIAHEMRNPLGQIKHNLESIHQALPLTAMAGHAVDTDQTDALYRHLAGSDMAVKRGLQVIAMTLDQVSAKPIDTTAFSYLCAGQATFKAVQEYGYETDADRRKVDVRVVEDFSFRGDETAYLFVLFNLLKNALYYRTFHPDIGVSITVERQVIRLRDDGPGIAPEVLAGLFEPFRSVGKSGGTGLGLAYCRRVMQAFGGQISCKSVLGEYTEFTLRFPAVGQEESEAHRIGIFEKARAAFAGKRLLVADDDAAQRLITCHKLQPLGAIVDQAANGQGALEALASQHYDLLLLDLNMPVLDGYAVAARVRRGDVPASRGVRIVAYTGDPPHLAKVKTQKAGMDGFIAKPCAQLQMVQALQRVLQQPAVASASDATLTGRRILLADDSPHNRSALAAYLEYAGAVVTDASHGGAVLEHLQGPHRWDAILMDISMPGMNGLDATRAIRGSAQAWHDIPIVALTAYSDPATVLAARSAGMNDFLVKPVEASALYEKLRQLTAVGTAPLEPTALAPALPPAAGGPLLDRARLESYQRMGLLQELLGDYLADMARLVEQLHRSVAQQDFQGSLDLLHSLLGTSGEAGAQALYQLVRRAYVPMLEEHTWPASPGWMERVGAVAAETEQALLSYGGMQASLSEG